jgi:hypothetical protein
MRLIEAPVLPGSRDWIMAGLAATDEDRTISVADLLRVVAALPQPPSPRPERDAA